MTLPPKIQKAAKRSSRWHSQTHRTHVRTYACCNCGSQVGVQAAHVRMGSGAGMGQKPDDWLTVPLCHDCHHGDQHTRLGEPEFWARYEKAHGQTVFQLIDALIETSPKRFEIREEQKLRAAA